MNPCIFLSAYEASGDRLGAAIITALKKYFPDARFIGAAGPLMREAGCEALLRQEDLAIMGFVDVIKHLSFLLKARRFLAKQALALKPEVFIGIDAPDSNLYIEKKLKEKGIKTVHVNSPTIWAWRSGRIKNIKHAVDLMLVLFPFEEKIYQENNIPVCFIGHPLADLLPVQADKNKARQKLHLTPDEKVLCLMPGSRNSEIKYLAPLFLQTAALCREVMPHLKFIAPMINAQRAKQFQMYCQDFPQLPIEVTVGNAHAILRASDAVLIASGTATLEAMLCQTPMVVSYRADPLSFWIAKKMVKIPYVSLPNILANKALVPELLQENATPHALAQACLSLLQHSDSNLIPQFQTLHKQLQQDAADKAANAIRKLLLSR